MTKLKFSLFLLLCLPFGLWAQSFSPDPDWRFENFSNQNHFVNREVLSLTLDHHGYVWACSDGLLRFDGYKTLEFNCFDLAKGALKTNNVDAVTDKNGRIWISSGGLCYYDEATSKFVYIQSDVKHPITYVIGCCFQKNYLWFICDYGLAKLDINTSKISFTSLSNVVDGLCTYLVNDNTLFVSSRERVYTYKIKEDSYTSNTLLYNNALVKISSIIKGVNDTFLGTNLGLFTIKNLKDISQVSEETKNTTITDVLFLPQDKEKKHLFLATDSKGIMVYNTVLKKIEFNYRHDDNNPFSLPNNIVNKFAVDKSGKLWIATVLGLSMLDVNNQQWKMRFLSKSNTDELLINRIARDKYDTTKVWMSSYSRTMTCIDWKTKAIVKKFDAVPETKKIYDFVQVSKNRWLIATQKIMMEWDSRTGTLLQKKLPVPDSILFAYYIRRIIKADANTCFITTNRGLFKYDLANQQFKVVSENKLSKKTEDLQYDLINGFYENGILWLATRNGLVRYNTVTGERTVYRGKGSNSDYYFFDINNAVNNQVVCSSGNGLTIFNKQTKTFRVLNTIANLLKPTCEGVISINNKVWTSSEAGILNYDLVTHASAKSEHETKLTQIFPGSPFAIIGNDIVVGFRNGYAYFRPELKNTMVPSDPVIEKVYVNNQPVLPDYSAQKNTPKLVLSHSNNAINIVYTAFLYSNPDHIQFRYRLKGGNPAWQYPQDQRSANFAQLPPGNYTFEVQSGNKNGIWNSHLASFGFAINPPYWAAWWFRLLLILAIAFGLYQLYSYKIRHILAIEKIRQRIASDFHDDIGSALSSISIFSEVADKHLQQQMPREETRAIIGHISHHSRSMLDAMDDIIWAVNPQNDHFNDLAVRMREFAIPLLEARNIQFEINIQQDIMDTRIKMETRKNIFLIFKECINNILKHANCTTMSVAVNKLHNQLELVIHDDGKGFDVNAANTRNGLKNMQKRAAEINGTLTIKTTQGNGTTIKLLINTI